jgi:hypothetical protein
MKCGRAEREGILGVQPPKFLSQLVEDLDFAKFTGKAKKRDRQTNIDGPIRCSLVTLKSNEYSTQKFCILWVLKIRICK